MLNSFINFSRQPINRTDFGVCMFVNLVLMVIGVAVAILYFDLTKGGLGLIMGIPIILYTAVMNIVLINNRVMSLGFHWVMTIVTIAIIMVPIIGLLPCAWLMFTPEHEPAEPWEDWV